MCLNDYLTIPWKSPRQGFSRSVEVNLIQASLQNPDIKQYPKDTWLGFGLEIFWIGNGNFGKQGRLRNVTVGKYLRNRAKCTRLVVLPNIITSPNNAHVRHFKWSWKNVGLR